MRYKEFNHNTFSLYVEDTDKRLVSIYKKRVNPLHFRNQRCGPSEKRMVAKNGTCVCDK